MDSENPAGLQPIQGESPKARRMRENLVKNLQQQVLDATGRTHAWEESFNDPDRTSANPADRGALAAGDIVTTQIEQIDVLKIQQRIEELRTSTLKEVKCACGKTIPSERLKVLPDTTQCISCATEAESVQRNANTPTAPKFDPPRSHPRW